MSRLLAICLAAAMASIASAQITVPVTAHPTVQKRPQTLFTVPSETTTRYPYLMTTQSTMPQTSISVRHSIVRNKPAYPYPYTESPLTADASSDDSSYYYTYEDMTEDSRKDRLTTVTNFTPPTTTTTPITTTKPIKSYWSNQKALLDARRQNTQKLSYTRPTVTEKTESNPTVTYKTREKPKFGQNKNKFIPTESKTTSTVSPSKMVKNSYSETNMAHQKTQYKDERTTSTTLSPLLNQLIGRFGELPLQNKLASLPLKAQSSVINNYGSLRSGKLDGSLSNLDTSAQQPTSRNQQQLLISNINQPSLLSNLNPPTGSIYIAATPAASNQGATTLLSNNQNSLLNRLGSLGLSLGGGSGNLAVLGREGGGGYPGKSGGFNINLGAIPDPLTFLLKLLSLIPRPLLDLNGRVFFGVELGKNAGLTAGAPVKYGG